GPAPVGTHPGDCTPEPAHICDLLGNVAEWTADPWRGRADDEPVDGQRAVRGGTYTMAPGSDPAKPTSRLKAGIDDRDAEIGFRCARDP
ncbi:MAG TPA: SUMF1/EgtB/PvdO family nonheme iron enzyme, partial [Kofleriaceae bacterium]|nr:SUMF1/EgtB/PvdO family nonheme iron enzyme [Kofleriaceae bacterium]